MTLSEKLMREFEQLTEEKKKEDIDFIEFVKAKEQKELENLMDAAIVENEEVLEEFTKNEIFIYRKHNFVSREDCEGNWWE